MMNVNTNLYSLNGVDAASVKKVASEILAKAQGSEPQVAALDYSKFNRKTLGLDLYSSRTSVDVQKQVASIQAGLYAKSVDVAQLNSFAAANLYGAAKVQKNVELTQSVNAIEFASPKNVEETNAKVELFNIQDGNSHAQGGYNPFASEETDEKGEK